ncbi:hypothetical protein Misp06_00752 [Microbulbifer sp. NBRC 101763]
MILSIIIPSCCHDVEKECQEVKILVDERRDFTKAFARVKNELSEVQRLGIENPKLKQEVDILGKWQWFLRRNISKISICPVVRFITRYQTILLVTRSETQWPL